MPCLSAIGCALPPDYSLSSGMDDEAMKHVDGDSGGPYHPQPIETQQYVFVENDTCAIQTHVVRVYVAFSVQVSPELNQLVQKFSEHYHDAWAGRKLENGWQYGEQYSYNDKKHPRLKPYNMLTEYASRPTPRKNRRNVTKSIPSFSGERTLQGAN